MERFIHIDTWVFDLDNTLYDAESHIFKEIGKRMTGLIAAHLNISEEAAAEKRHSYYLKYGTTLRGMMSEHGIAPDAFLRHAHDVDPAPVPPCAITREYLGHLPGRKIIFTNSPRHFARTMLDHLDLAHHFDAIHAIEDADYWPKPHVPSYQSFLKKYEIDPKRACMFEDMAINLKPAHDLGMTTVWLHGQDHNPAEPHPEHIHHKAVKLPDWLRATIRKQP